MHFRVAADKLIESRGAHEFAVGQNLRVRLPFAPLVRPAGECGRVIDGRDGDGECLISARIDAAIRGSAVVREIEGDRCRATGAAGLHPWLDLAGHQNLCGGVHSL